MGKEVCACCMRVSVFACVESVLFLCGGNEVCAGSVCAAISLLVQP